MDSAIIGKGIVDWSKVLPAVKKSSVTSAYLELEEPYDPSPNRHGPAERRLLEGQALSYLPVCEDGKAALGRLLFMQARELSFAFQVPAQF
jgi:hypothetical protein